MTARIMIVATHLLGVGHLVRAATLARALATVGFDVTLVSGGMPAPVVAIEQHKLVQLPPLQVHGTNFSDLLDEAWQPIDQGRLATRRAMLGELARDIAPDVLITEHFPLGRRQLANEFLSVIEAVKLANPAVLTLSSVRDIMVAPRRAERITEANRRAIGLFDAVLVHGDKTFLPLDLSWPTPPELQARLIYTGYVSEPREAAYAAGPDGEILVSGGGSSSALPFFQSALAAARLYPEKRPWRVLIGYGVQEADFVKLQSQAAPHVTVERARRDFPALLTRCAVSVSLAGYNTVLDLIHTRCPAIVVPYDGGNETEQAMRAAALERAGLARALPFGHATADPELIAQAIGEAVKRGPLPAARVDINGAERTAAIVRKLLQERR